MSVHNLKLFPVQPETYYKFEEMLTVENGSPAVIAYRGSHVQRIHIVNPYAESLYEIHAQTSDLRIMPSLTSLKFRPLHATVVAPWL